MRVILCAARSFSNAQEKIMMIENFEISLNACNTVEHFSGSEAAPKRMTSTITTVLCEANTALYKSECACTLTLRRCFLSLDFLWLPFPFVYVAVKHIACMNPLYFSRFRQLSRAVNVTRCASVLQMCQCG